MRTFDATEVIKALPGGAECAGGVAGSMVAPQTGTVPGETFVKTWMTSCPIDLPARDAFLSQVLEAIAPVDHAQWDGAGGAMAVSRYEEGDFIGWVNVATRAHSGGLEIAVTVQEETASSAGRSSSQTYPPSPISAPLPAAPRPPLAAATPESREPTPVPLPASGALPRGTYFLANPYADNNPVRSCARGCSDYARIIFTLPPGWATSNGLVYKHLDQSSEVAISFWTVDKVYADPCHWQKSPLSPLDIYNTRASGAALFVDPENGGLSHQLGRRASPLTQTMIGGQSALRIELSVPAELDLASCDRGQFRSWGEWDVPDGANSNNAPGQLDDVYMVDVDRRPLVIDASHMPTSSDRDLAELEGVLASMNIER